MAVNAKICLLTKDAAWHTTNAAIVLDAGRVVYLSGSNPMKSKVGDGVTALSALEWQNTIVQDYIIVRSSGPDGRRWKFTCDDTGMLVQPGEDLGV